MNICKQTAGEGRRLLNLRACLARSGIARRISHPILVQSDELDPSQRWTLVQVLYDQYRGVIEGGIVVCLVEAIIALITGSRVFVGLLAAVVVTTACRGMMTVLFFREVRRAVGERRGRPESWAKYFVIGNCAMAGLFGLTTFLVCVASREPALQLLVILVEAGWVASSTQRSATTPAGVFGQTVLITVPTIIGAACSGSLLVYCVIPFVIAYASSSQASTRFFGDLFLRVMLREQQLAAANARLTQLLATDGLTGIGNRRAFDSDLPLEVGRAARTRSHLALLMIDVDNFKAYNDLYGHPAGDECLRRVARQIRGALCRPSDTVARFGGEEFVVLLPATMLEGAREVAERILRSVADAGIPHEASGAGRVTVSIGAASLVPADASAERALLEIADAALYRAKTSGRNKVCTASAVDWVVASGAAAA